MPFTVYPATKMGDVIAAYSQRAGIREQSYYRFLFDGDRLNDMQTVKSLEMEDEDTIDVSREMTGGTCMPSVSFLEPGVFALESHVASA